MALSGLEIYKLLPKTNCKDCGFPTCLAFAMKLSQQQVELSTCPHVSDEATAQLEAASAPPMRLVTLSNGDRKLEVGNETEMFRHEKTFVHPCGLMVRIMDDWSADEIKQVASDAGGYTVERVGIELFLDGLAVENASGDAAAFAEAVKTAMEASQVPLILISKDPKAMAAAVEAAEGTQSLLCGADKDNWSEMAALAKDAGWPLVVQDGEGLESLANLVEEVKGAGVEDIVLDTGARELGKALQDMTQIRRLALNENFRPLGYPIINFAGEGTDSLEDETIAASQFIAKYGGFVVLDRFDPAMAYALLTLRQNIYTDPQKPIQVSPGIYEIGEPKPESPLMVTTNFSLTYFSVAGEVEASNVPSWLLIGDSEGMSVLTAWAAGKFDAESIAKSVQTTGMADKIDHKRIIIPGYVAAISGELEEELEGWEILVGPRESIDIPKYLKTIMA